LDEAVEGASAGGAPGDASQNAALALSETAGVRQANEQLLEDVALLQAYADGMCEEQRLAARLLQGAAAPRERGLTLHEAPAPP
jgi:hypothetical protein